MKLLPIFLGAGLLVGALEHFGLGWVVDAVVVTCCVSYLLERWKEVRQR